MPRTLHLTLSRKPFEVMVTGEKTDEYRKASKWIESRLIDKNGNPREYDQIMFTNGYGGHRPYFICEWRGFEMETDTLLDPIKFSNGLEVNISEGDFTVRCGKIIEIGNWPHPGNK